MFDNKIAKAKPFIVGWYMYFSELWFGLIDKFNSIDDDDDNWPHGGFAV